MTHQQRSVSGYKSKERTGGGGGGGKSKQNNFLKLSLPGGCVVWKVLARYLRVPSLGLGLLRKFQQYRRLPQDPGPAQGHHLEEELDRLTSKIDNLLCKIEGQDQDTARGQEEEVTTVLSCQDSPITVIFQCVVCGTNRACMQTLPCAHQVVCRKCFVRTIQMAVAQKRLPLRCIMCRAKVLKIKQNGALVTGKEEMVVVDGDGLPKSVSGYNINNNISCSGSNYSFTSGIIQPSVVILINYLSNCLLNRSLCCFLREQFFS